MTFVPAARSRWQECDTLLGTDAAASVNGHVGGVIDGSIAAIAMPWEHLTRLTRAFLPGTVSVVCGDPGSSKSLLVLQLCYALFAARVPIALYEMECDVRFHSMRLLSQLAGESNMTDPDWIKANPQRATALANEHAEAIRDFGYRMTASANKPVDYDAVLGWISAGAARGVKLFAIDPITAATPEREPWIADTRFVTEARKRIEASGAALLVVSHPKKGRKNGVGFDELAGGAAWARFTDCVMWLERPKEPVPVRIAGPFGSHTENANRIMTICKARNGVGTGMQVGMRFSGESLTFDELGVIVEDAA